MKEGFRPKHKKLLTAWTALIDEGKTPIYDVDIYRRAYPNQNPEYADKTAYKVMRELRELMEIKDYIILYKGTPADFMRRFEENTRATRPVTRADGELNFIPDNGARNTANKDYAEYMRQLNGDTDEAEANEIRIFVRRSEEETAAGVADADN